MSTYHQQFGLDWAWGHISPSQLRGVGASFAARYLSHDSGKDLSRGEADALSANGIDIVVVWETLAREATYGYAAGVSDAHQAYAKARACGMPAHRPIFFAVDDDLPESSVDAYFAGVGAALPGGPRQAGAYGGIRVISGLFDRHRIGFAWQTYAWSGGAWDPRAGLHQYSNDHYVAGVGVDYDRSVKPDFGQWRVGQTGKPPKYPGHRIKPGDHGPNVGLIQVKVGVAADGVFGPKTTAAVKAYKRAHRLPWANDAVIGPLVWRAMFH